MFSLKIRAPKVFVYKVWSGWSSTNYDDKTES